MLKSKNKELSADCRTTPYYNAKANRLCERLNAYIRTVVRLLGEDYSTINESEEGVILTHTYVLTCIVNSAALFSPAL